MRLSTLSPARLGSDHRNSRRRHLGPAPFVPIDLPTKIYLQQTIAFQRTSDYTPRCSALLRTAA